MGSVADSVAAKIRIIIDNTNSLAGKITQKWNSLTSLTDCTLQEGRFLFSSLLFAVRQKFATFAPRLIVYTYATQN